MLASILRPLFQKENGEDKYPRDLKKRLAVVTRNMKLGKVVDKIRGPSGTHVTLQVKKEEGAIEDYTMKRQTVNGLHFELGLVAVQARNEFVGIEQ